MDRERRSWERQPHDLEAAAKAFRARIRAGALSPAQAALLTAIGEPAACHATQRPRPWQPRGLILAVGPDWRRAARELLGAVEPGRLVLVVDPDLAEHGLAPSDSQDVETGWGLGLGRIAAEHHQARLLVGRSTCTAPPPEPIPPSLAHLEPDLFTSEAPLGHDLEFNVLPAALGHLVVLLGLPEPWPVVLAALRALRASSRSLLAAALLGVTGEAGWRRGEDVWPALLGSAP